MPSHESSIGQTPTGEVKQNPGDVASDQSPKTEKVTEDKRASRTGFEPFDYNKHYGRDDES